MPKFNEVETYYRSAGVLLTPCQLCVNMTYLGDPTGKDSTCTAYPEGGIPNEIFTGEVEHTNPYKGDNGTQYEGEFRVLDGKTYQLGWGGALEDIK